MTSAETDWSSHDTMREKAYLIGQCFIHLHADWPINILANTRIVTGILLLTRPSFPELFKQAQSIVKIINLPSKDFPSNRNE